MGKEEGRRRGRKRKKVNVTVRKKGRMAGKGERRRNKWLRKYDKREESVKSKCGIEGGGQEKGFG